MSEPTSTRLSSRIARTIYLRMALPAVQAAVQKWVDEGKFGTRVQPRQKIELRGLPQPMLQRDGTWGFPNISFYRAGDDDAIKGGNNIQRDATEVKRIRRSAERELALRYPHFADWTAPYFLMWFAPAAGLFALIQRHWSAIVHFCSP